LFVLARMLNASCPEPALWVPGAGLGT
jgi:hypothetical protein